VGTLFRLTALAVSCLAYGCAARRVGWAGSAAAVPVAGGPYSAGFFLVFGFASPL
jgi:hypothetical protein